MVSDRKKYALVLDVDDTLILSLEKYNLARELYSEEIDLLQPGFSGADAVKLSQETDLAESSARKGSPETKNATLRRDRFPLSLLRAYRALSGRPVPDEDAERIRTAPEGEFEGLVNSLAIETETDRILYGLAGTALEPKWKLRKGARKMAESLQASGLFDFYAATIGDGVVQDRKYESVPLLQEIFPDKDKQYQVAPLEKTEILAKLAEEYGAENVVFVTDSKSDAKYTKAAGVKMVLVPLLSGKATHWQEKALGATEEGYSTAKGGLSHVEAEIYSLLGL